MALVFSGPALNAQYITVTDTVFAKYLCTAFPDLMSTDCKMLDTAKAKLQTGSIDVYEAGITTIQSADELKYFEQIINIKLRGNQIPQLPVSSGDGRRPDDILPNLLLLFFGGRRFPGPVRPRDINKSLHTGILDSAS